MLVSHKLKILHICNFYAGASDVYERLFSEIDQKKYLQTVYVQHRKVLKTRNQEFSTEGSNILMRPILNQLTRLLYFYKCYKTLKDVESSINFQKYNIIHAHTWITDGGVAYLLNKKYGTPYIITIRSTDINTYIKWFLHIKPLAKKILLNASKIIFVSKVLEKKFFSLKFIQEDINYIKNKSIIIPNGIDSFWFENLKERKLQSTDNIIKLIYVGNFLKRKNVQNLIKAMELIKNQGRKVNLKLIGGGRLYSNKLMDKINDDSDIQFLGRMEDKTEIASHLNSSDIFTMPSYGETFGLVYIEALSQGIPIIYTRNDGIDGLVENNVGESVNPFDPNDIADKILTIYDNYSSYNFNPGQAIDKNKWEVLTQEILSIYEDALLIKNNY